MEVLTLDIEELNRVFGGLECPNVVAVINHAAFAAATNDMLNDMGNELLSLADILDEFDDPELLDIVQESERKCAAILESLLKMGQQPQQIV